MNSKRTFLFELRSCFSKIWNKLNCLAILKYVINWQSIQSCINIEQHFAENGIENSDAECLWYFFHENGEVQEILRKKPEKFQW